MSNILVYIHRVLNINRVCFVLVSLLLATSLAASLLLGYRFAKTRLLSDGTPNEVG